LAIAIDSEYGLDIDLGKVLKMLVLHELEEVVIGDLTPYDNVTAEDKIQMGKSAVKSLLGEMIKEEEYVQLLDEFNAHETRESSFAFMCDKLEADLQAKLYSEEDCCDIHSAENSHLLERDWNKKAIEDGATSLADLFISYDVKHFDDIFTEMAMYVKQNTILSDEIKRLKK